jgi:hypothetical protein
MTNDSDHTSHPQGPAQPAQTADQGDQPPRQQDNLTFWQLLSSTIAAALGVQSRANRERDFTRGKALHFIFMGIAFTVFFVLAVVGVVNLVLS